MCYGFGIHARIGSCYRLETGPRIAVPRKLVVAPVGAPYPMRDGVEVMNLLSAVRAVGEFS